MLIGVNYDCFGKLEYKDYIKQRIERNFIRVLKVEQIENGVKVVFDELRVKNNFKLVKDSKLLV